MAGHESKRRPGLEHFDLRRFGPKQLCPRHSGPNLLEVSLAALLILLASAAGSAQPSAGGGGSQTRAARLTFLQGSVTLQSGENTAAQPAEPNAPLLAGTHVATGPDGQAEVEFEDGSVVRLTPNSALALDTLRVDPDGTFSTNLVLLHGLAYAELRATTQYRYSITAGGDALVPVENTTVRIDYDEPPAVFAVFDGTAHITGIAGYSADVAAGDSLRSDPAEPGRYAITQQIAQDTWDQWNFDRDEADGAEATTATSARDDYAGAQGYGWSDLDADGTWYQVPGQGPVWQPLDAADAGFDPYANGAWVYYPSTGYIWASAYPWGWTPYRCGGWSYYNGFGWGWVPSGCGGFGWGFYPGGGFVNILLPPRGYPPIRVPRPQPGPVHPPIPVRLATANRPAYSGHAPTATVSQVRQIDGHPAYQILPISSGYTPGTAAAHVSALQRDYPVNAASHTPVLGRPSSQPAATLTNSGWRPAPSRSTTTYPSRSASGVAPANRPAPTPRPAPVPQRPAYTPPPRPAPAPAPASHPAPK